MDDSERNKIILRVVSKIQEDGVSPNEQDPSIMEKYVKYVILIGIILRMILIQILLLDIRVK